MQQLQQLAAFSDYFGDFLPFFAWSMDLIGGTVCVSVCVCVCVCVCVDQLSLSCHRCMDPACHCVPS